MIEMWDAAFREMSPPVGDALSSSDGNAAFELMHQELDRVWKHCFRVLRPGRFACVNIGDAVRTIGDDFQIYPNHARIVSAMSKIGFAPLPDVLWRKQTNAPNKFMGSGMLPAGAYVTYEHEYVLIFRKGAKRLFKSEEEKLRRRQSAFFWEERNVWFSDIWTDLKGTSQGLVDEAVRERSAAFPFELPYRLISMYSVYGDTVLDPFLGTGTTAAAAVASGRNSVGVEAHKGFLGTIDRIIRQSVKDGIGRIRGRITQHIDFADSRTKSGYEFKHRNEFYGFYVMTSQERDLLLYQPESVKQLSPDEYQASHVPATRASGAVSARQLSLLDA